MKLTIKNVRLSFRNLNEPYKNKYNATFLLDNTLNADTIKELQEGINKTLANYRLESNQPKFRVALENICLKDGSKKINKETGEQVKSFIGQQYFKASRSIKKSKVILVDQLKNPIEDSEVFYSGCYVNTVINFFIYDHVKAGEPTHQNYVSCELVGLQFLKHGERFGGDHAESHVDENDFDVVEDETIPDFTPQVLPAEVKKSLKAKTPLVKKPVVVELDDEDVDLDPFAV